MTTQKLPAGLTIIPNFINEDTEQELLTNINKQVWQTSLKRRVQHYGYPYNYRSRNVEKDENTPPLPNWTKELQQAMIDQEIIEQPFEQLIINEYQPGQGIGRHFDALSFGNRIACLSLGSPCTMNFFHRTKYDQRDRIKKTKHLVSLTLPRRSLLIMKDQARYNWTHQIPARTTDRTGVRVSLTFRYLAETDPMPN